jgi:hypothetical protein
MSGPGIAHALVAPGLLEDFVARVEARARRLLADQVSLERVWAEVNACEDAAASMVEAVMHAARAHGVAAIATNRERLFELSPNQLEDVVVRLSRVRPRYPATTDHLLELLTELLP